MRKMKHKYAKLLIVFVSAILILIGCSSGGGNNSQNQGQSGSQGQSQNQNQGQSGSQGKGQQAVAETVVIGRINLGDETFLPWNGNAERFYYLSGTIYESLFYKDRMGRDLPMLAKEYTMSPDGLVWTIRIHEGIQFHDGWGEVTSEDVKYTFDRLMGDDSVMHITPGLRDEVDRMETPDKYTIVFYLKKPNPVFHNIYLGSDMVGVVSKKYVEQVGDQAANDKPIGTGPYTLSEHVSGAHIVLTTIDGVENHWRITPDFKNIKLVVRPELQARVAGLKAGELDLVEIEHAAIPELQKVSGVHVIRRNEGADVDLIRFGGINMLNEKVYTPTNPWVDERVRQAMSYAINKQEIADTIFYGLADPAPSGSYIAEWDHLPPYPYDPAKAKALLAEAGYPNGFSVTLVTDNRSSNPILAEIVAGYWREIGLDVKLETMDWPSLRESWATGGMNNKVWVHRGVYSGNDPLTSVDLPLTPASSMATYSDETSEKLRQQYRGEMDAQKRSQYLRELGEYLHQKAAWGQIVKVYRPAAMSEKIVEPTETIDVLRNVEYLKANR